MKTYEAEKGNTPEGATGYREQGNYIEWFSGSEGCWRLIASTVPSITMCDTSKPVIPIPQTKEVEWVNGDECVFTDREGNEKACTVIGLFTGCEESYVLYGNGVNPSTPLFVSNVRRMKKPESPEDREKRERMEGAYDLYFDHLGGAGGHTICDYEFFVSEPDLNLPWLSTVDKTGYRKGGESNRLNIQLDSFVHYAHQEAMSDSCVFDCDEGKGRFISEGSVNALTSRIKRAIQDDHFRDWFVGAMKEELEQSKVEK